MNETPDARLRPGVELVQPAVIRLYANLVRVYRSMHERQREIDAAFDRVASQIGFVVTTTLPVQVEVGEGGTARRTSFAADALRGTIFEKELSGFVDDLTRKPFADVPPGTYRYYLIWYEALNLKLRFDCCESVHVLQGMLGSLMGQRGTIAPSALVPPDVKESAHWFDPGVAIAIEDALAILAIDEVYPELRLAERIQAGRLAASRLAWAGLRPWHASEQAPISFSEQLVGRELDILTRIRAMLGKQPG